MSQWAKPFARILGALFLLIGVAGFFVQDDLFGVFHSGSLHNGFHVIIGVWGLAASTRGESSSVWFAKTAGIVYLLLGAIGVFTPHFLGMHLMMSDNIVHLVIGAAATYLGYVLSPTEPDATREAA